MMNAVLLSKLHLKSGLCISLFFFSCLGVSFASNDKEPVTESTKKLVFSNEPFGVDVILQLVLSMVLVIGVIILFAWLMRRAGGFNKHAGNTLQVLGGLSVGTREKVVLIRVGDTQLLLGVAPGQVRKLHELDIKGNHRDAFDKNNGREKKEPGFSDRLKTALGKGSE